MSDGQDLSDRLSGLESPDAVRVVSDGTDRFTLGWLRTFDRAERQEDAHITTRAGLKEADLGPWCRVRLSSMKTPKRFFLRENLPKTPNGKGDP
jgi:hypothetical protein